MSFSRQGSRDKGKEGEGGLGAKRLRSCDRARYAHDARDPDDDEYGNEIPIAGAGVILMEWVTLAHKVLRRQRQQAEVPRSRFVAWSQMARSPSPSPDTRVSVSPGA